jgi:hemerythrin-like domain-containing protein
MSSTTPRPARKARPARAAAPPLPVMEKLDATHRQVMVTLDQLQALVDRLEDDGINDETRACAAAICSFFDDSARAHHAAEETHVFPALLAGTDVELIQHVRRLQQDHGWLEEDWLELQPQLSALSEGYSWYDAAFLRAAVPVFAQLYRDHIALEEDVVYPASRRG